MKTIKHLLMESIPHLPDKVGGHDYAELANHATCPSCNMYIMQVVSLCPSDCYWTLSIISRHVCYVMLPSRIDIISRFQDFPLMLMNEKLNLLLQGSSSYNIPIYTTALLHGGACQLESA